MGIFPAGYGRNDPRARAVAQRFRVKFNGTQLDMDEVAYAEEGFVYVPHPSLGASRRASRSKLGIYFRGSLKLGNNGKVRFYGDIDTEHRGLVEIEELP